MKKFITLFLTLTTLATLTACDQKPESEEANVATKGYASVLNVDTATPKTETEEYNNLQSFEVLPKDVYILMQNDESIKLIDVREPAEYEKSHIVNSILIPIGSLSEAVLRQNNIKNTDYIILYCRSGNRGARAYYILQSLGYYTVNSMAGGITKWITDSLPVE